MKGSFLLLLSTALPLAAGAALPAISSLKKPAHLKRYVLVVLSAVFLLSLALLFTPERHLTLFCLTDELPLALSSDAFSRIFALLAAFMFLLSGIYSFEYMKHEKRHTRFYTFYLLTLGCLIGLGYSSNLVTMYLFFELMTLMSVPLVLHSGSDFARRGAEKYLFYSITGACLGLFGIILLYSSGAKLDFVPGGYLGRADGALLAGIFLSVLGFGAKAGLFPLEAWLPAAHPVAPAPASAVLSGVITKAGVLAVFRLLYFVAGPEAIAGTWVQTVLIVFSLITVILGSTLAYREKLLKRRMAYSTVSQVSYILFGLFLLNETAASGALAHVVFHSVIKDALFLCVGAVIFETGLTRADEMRGIGKRMPVTMWCFTISSLALVGIPPLSGFVSKWYLAMGSLASGIGVLSVWGPAVLLISALLTAGYLFSVSVNAFFPGRDFDYSTLKKCEPGREMTVPLIILTALSVVFGLFPAPLLSLVRTALGGIF